MKLNILWLLIAFFLVNCSRSDHKMSQQSVEKDTLKTIREAQESSPIKSVALINLLTAYIAEVEVRSNSGRTPIYVIIFRHDKKEKRLSISGELALPIFMNIQMNDSLELKGVCFLNKNSVLIYDKIVGVGDYFYTPSELNKDTIVYFQKQYEGIDVRDNIDYPDWIYKIKPNNELELKEKTKMIIMK